jgi:hypothetical protein
MLSVLGKSFERFSRTRPDDQVVELFLAWWEEGRFATNPDWLPQNINNVEAIARDAEGGKLAIEHTRVHTFEGHQREEIWMGQVAAQVESAPELQSPGRRLSIIFNRDLFDDLNDRKRGEYTKALIAWLAEQFRCLSLGSHRLTTPQLLPNKKPIEIEVQVDESLDDPRPISVSGMLPEDAAKRAVPQVERALKKKLTKLIDAQADSKVLLVELPTVDTSTSLIIELIKNSSIYATRLERSRWRGGRLRRGRFWKRVLIS